MQSLTDSNGYYRTPPNMRNPLAGILPTPIFYTTFLRYVFHFSHLARKGLYDDRAWWASSLAVLRALERAGTQIEISGMNALEQFPGACVLVANHMSTLETIILPGIVQPTKDVTFVIKRGIAEYPVFKHIIMSRNPIVVDRVSPREDLLRVLEEGSRILETGRSIVVFPQTTRALTFDPEQFNSIGVKLAKRTGVPIVPVAVRTDAWGIGRLVKEFGRIDPSRPVRFAFGEPIPVQGSGKAEHAAVINFISSKLDAWGVPVINAERQQARELS